MIKTCIIDSSSAILLFKVEIFEELLEYYRVICPPAVIAELTRNQLYPGAEYFRTCCDRNRLLVNYPEASEMKIVEKECNSMGLGEIECIALFYKKAGDFILVDDKKGALFCRKNNIPYINALLVPKILFLSGIVTESNYNKLFSLLLEKGRYSKKIIQYASKMQMNDFSDFLKI